MHRLPYGPGMVNVEAWLKCLGLEQYAEAFAQNGDGKKLTDAGVKLAKRIGNCYAPGIIGGPVLNPMRHRSERPRSSGLSTPLPAPFTRTGGPSGTSFQ